MRDMWQTTEMNHGAKFGFATYPRQLKSLGIKSLLERALRAQGLVKPLDKEKKERRREWKGAHGLRKFYQTTAERVMKSINVELTMGHQLGTVTSYYKPSENDVLADYLKAVDLLTIDFEEIDLRKRAQKLEEEKKNNDYFIKGKLIEKDEEISRLKEDQMVLNDAFTKLSDKLSKLTEEFELINIKTSLTRDLNKI